MKRFTKIFFAVAALVGAYACTTDVTEDLGVKVGDQTTITISLDESRTQLGEAANGLYPVTWSAGDKISANGITSNEANISSSNPSSATFTLNTTVTPPLRLAYPAAADNQVIFAQEQTHTEGTFANGVATMYGYAKENESLSMHHLTGVLKIGVTGEAKLKKAQISTVNGPIAGVYNIDFTTGEVTPSAEAVDVINYSFGEGLQLTETAQYLHIAVPAGEYNYLHVTLYDSEGGVMVANVKADDTHPLTAGSVRVFKTPIAYAANSTDCVIYDYATLKAFADAVAAATADAPYTKNALVVENITIPADAEWTPIEGFTNTFNGNGYEISGLTNSLFGTVKGGTIKNLKLTDVAIVDTESYIYSEDVDGVATERVTVCTGAIARQLNNGSLLNCKVYGSLEVNTASHTATATIGDYKDICIGGVVGRLDGATVEGVDNYLSLTITEMWSDDITIAYQHMAGTVFGTAATNSSITEVRNYGKFTYNATPVTSGNGYFGGVIGGSSDTDGMVKFTHIENHGEVLYSEEAYRCATGQAAGVIAYLHSGVDEASHLTNYGKVTVVGRSSAKQISVGGVVASAYCNVSYCTNYGEIYAGGPDSSNACGNLYLGGVCASAYQQVSYCVNNGNVTIGGYFANGYLGGVSSNGGLNMSYDNCSNSATLFYNPLKSSQTHLAAICAQMYSSAEDLTTISVTNCHNTGKIIYQPAEGGTSAGDKNIGCLFGKFNSSKKAQALVIDNCSNSGDLILNGTLGTTGDTNIRLGAIVSYLLTKKAVTISNVTMSGKIIFGDDPDTPAVETASHVGSCHISAGVGTWTAPITMTNCTNNGDITVDANITSSGSKDVHVSAFSGYGSYSFDLINCVNNGDIRCAGTFPKSGLNLGGLMGYDAGVYTVDTVEDGAHEYTNCVNNGNLIYAANTPTTVRIGGIVGRLSKAHKVTITNCRNFGDIILEGDAELPDANAIYIGGLVSVSGAAPIDFIGCYNEGDFLLGGTKSVGGFYIGGLIGQAGAATTYKTTSEYPNLYNKGNAEVTIKTVGRTRIGGLAASFEKAGTINSFTNYGNFTMVNAESSYLYIGGVIGNLSGAVTINDGIKNYGDLTVSKVNADVASDSDASYVGGIVGRSTKPISKGECYADISAVKNIPNVGMIMASPRADGSLATDCKLGGSIATTMSTIEDADGVFTEVPNKIEISADNYFNYIYGGTTSWGDTNYDGCSFLSAAPAI